MARYFFDTVDGGDYRDDEGVELPDIVAARVEAVRLAGALIADHPATLAGGLEFDLQVRGENNRPLFTLMVSVREDGPPLLND